MADEARSPQSSDVGGFTELEGIREGELIEIEVRKAERDWFGSLKGVGHFAKGDELDTHD